MNNITVEVFFQKFDKECDTFIDLEMNDKDKMKAVVTHTLGL